MSEFANVGKLGFRNPAAALPEQPGIRTMQLSFNSEGTAVYKPVASNSDGIDINVVIGGGGEKKRKKRGRARKETPPESVAMEFNSGVFEAARDLHAPQQKLVEVGRQRGEAFETVGKKRGRPPVSANKKQVHEQQQFDDFGSPGIGFTLHVITVNTGEDVSSKIMSFSQNGPRAICILSAIGTISSVTLSQAATPGGSVSYEGRFEILSLSGSFMLSENGASGGRSRTGGLSVSLAGPDDFVVGGGVAGLLTAASAVQVVVGSFIVGGQKEPKISSSTEPLYTPSRLHTFTGPPRPISPPSRGSLSESSDEPDSPINQTAPPDFANLPWK